MAKKRRFQREEELKSLLSKKDYNTCPVNNASWNETQAFILKLNKLTGKKFRLPTEAEWEFAAKGGNKSSGFKYSGSNNLNEVAWNDKNLNGKILNPVGTKKANELGLYDMSGNGFERCQDWYSSVYYENSPIQNPKGPKKGDYRVLRSGISAKDCRVTSRSYISISSLFLDFGFRLVEDF